MNKYNQKTDSHYKLSVFNKLNYFYEKILYLS